MFCNYCGKEIDDDSKFCSYCGAELIQKKTEQTKNEGKKESFVVAKFFLNVIAIFACMFISLFALVKCSMNSDSTGNIFDQIIERDIKKSDYTARTSQDLTSWSVSITPNLDFNSCTVECIVYDSKGQIVYSDTKTKENLKEGKPYTYTFDFGVVGALKADHVSYKITGKCFG